VVNFDAVVVGGSVAGATTARLLGLRGLRVALLDKAKFPRPKPCGEGLLPHGVAALRDMGLDIPGVRVKGLRYVSPSGERAEADFPDGTGYVVRRSRLDHYLFEEAARTPNVEAFPETPYDPGRWSARWVVGADGLHSRFHRTPGFTARPPEPRRVGLSTHVRGLRVDPDRVEVILHERGEVYLAPSEEGEALVACLYRKDNLPEGPSNEERVRLTLQSLRALKDRIGDLTFTTPCLAAAPLGLRVNSVVSGRTLLVGDAAGAPDPVTGEGMSLAILSARAAAQAIAEDRPDRYAQERPRLAAASDWLSHWLLRAARFPRVADRVVASLAERPELFRKLLEMAVGTREEGDLSLGEIAQLVL
jgi:flavin-dependent dehydrogenase